MASAVVQSNNTITYDSNTGLLLEDQFLSKASKASKAEYKVKPRNTPNSHDIISFDFKSSISGETSPTHAYKLVFTKRAKTIPWLVPINNSSNVETNNSFKVAGQNLRALWNAKQAGQEYTQVSTETAYQPRHAALGNNIESHEGFDELTENELDNTLHTMGHTGDLTAIIEPVPMPSRLSQLSHKLIGVTQRFIKSNITDDLNTHKALPYQLDNYLKNTCPWATLNESFPITIKDTIVTSSDELSNIMSAKRLELKTSNDNSMHILPVSVTGHGILKSKHSMLTVTTKDKTFLIDSRRLTNLLSPYPDMVQLSTGFQPFNNDTCCTHCAAYTAEQIANRLLENTTDQKIDILAIVRSIPKPSQQKLETMFENLVNYNQSSLQLK